MLKNYETVFILTPVLSEEQMKEVVVKFRDFITEHKGKIVHEDQWGLRKLAYPIQKKSTGFYYLIEFKASGDLIAKLEVEFKRDERIIRFLTVSLDKHAVDYNDRKRNGLIGRNKKVKEEATVAPSSN
jgi:small subunit ribosomal protein S6